MTQEKPAVFYNRIIDKGRLKKLMSWAYTKYGSAHCATMADELKTMGFRYATQAGVSISVNDLEVPPVKRQMLESAEQEIRTTEARYSRGEITEVELLRKRVQFDLEYIEQWSLLMDFGIIAQTVMTVIRPAEAAY